MAELATMARPYAEAAFRYAKETGSTESWSDMLSFLAQVMADEELVRAAQNPKIPAERFTDLLLDICQGHIAANGEKFIRLLIENNRLNLAKPIAELFEQYKAEDEGYIEVEVATAYPLPERDRKRLASSLEKILGKTVRLDVKEDRSLIGGVRVRAGDKVIDGSVRGQLERLAKRLYS